MFVLTQSQQLPADVAVTDKLVKLLSKSQENAAARNPKADAKEEKKEQAQSHKSG